MLSSFSLFTLQSPWALIALSALAIPLIIHLISKGRPTLVKFANVSLIKAIKPKSMRHMLLTEFWLLILRLLLLIVSILLLAQVLFVNPLADYKHVTLVTAQWLNSSSADEKSALLSLHAGEPIYLLSSDSQPLSKIDVLQWQNSQSDVDQHEDVTRHNLIKENTYLDLYYFTNAFSEKTTFDLFVTDSAKQFPESEITLAHDIKWHIKNTHIGNHNSEGAESGNKNADNKNQYHDSLTVVIVYDDDRAEDIKYFQQALSAINRLSAPKLSQQLFLNNALEENALENNALYHQAISSKPDWIFYLSSAIPDNAMLDALKAGSNIFVDAENAKVNLLSSSVVELNNNHAKFSPANIMFYQRAKPLNMLQYLPANSYVSSDESLWEFYDQNTEVKPLLLRSELVFDHALEQVISDSSNNTSIKTSHLYQLFSRFSPSWSNLLTTKQFPLLLQNILFEHWQAAKADEEYRLTQSQIILNQELKNNDLSAFESLVSVTNQHKNMSSSWLNILICLLLILWLVERLVSEITLQRKSKTLTTAHGESSVDEAAG